MNIFHLSHDPALSAESLCDKHVPKMLLETAQILSTALREFLPDVDLKEIYQTAYPYHPMTRWAGASRYNFQWTLFHGLGICLEYKKRFGREHASESIIFQCEQIAWNKGLLSYETVANFHKKMSEPPQCMPNQYKMTDYVAAYRKYYICEKKYFAQWRKGRSAPSWWVAHVG